MPGFLACWLGVVAGYLGVVDMMGGGSGGYLGVWLWAGIGVGVFCWGWYYFLLRCWVRLRYFSLASYCRWQSWHSALRRSRFGLGLVSSWSR